MKIILMLYNLKFLNQFYNLMNLFILIRGNINYPNYNIESINNIYIGHNIKE